MDKYTQMASGSVGRIIIKLALPSIASMMITSIYNIADTFFVGRISTVASAALGVAFPVMSIIQALGFFCGHGAGTFISRKLGEKEVAFASVMAATGFCLSFLLGVCVAFFGLLFLTPFLRLVGATSEIMGAAKTYMTPILFAAPFMTASLTINNELRFQGNAFYTMIALLSGAFINIVLDPLLIFVVGLGIRGAALATAVSQVISFVFLFIMTYTKGNIPIRIEKVKFSLPYIIQIINGGTPSLFRQGLGAVAVTCLNSMAGSIGGGSAIAGMAICNRFVMAANCALIGLGQGYQPVCAFCYGAKLYDRVKKGFWFCVKVGTIFLFCTSCLSMLFARSIIAFFRDDVDVIVIGSAALRFQSISFLLAAFTVMSNMFLQSIGRGVKASIAAASRNGIFFIPLIMILPRFFGLSGLEVTQAIADVLAFCLTLPLGLSELRRLGRK